jgi:hypothetical protein
MGEFSLSLRSTDSSHVVLGEMSISHVLNLSLNHNQPVVNGTSRRMLGLRGFKKLSDFGSYAVPNIEIIERAGSKFESDFSAPSILF